MKEKVLVAKMERLRVRLAGTGEVLKGSLSPVGSKKGQPQHNAGYLLTYKGKANKTQSVYIRKDMVPTVKGMIRNYKQAKQTLEDMVETNVKLFKARRD